MRFSVKNRRQFKSDLLKKNILCDKVEFIEACKEPSCKAIQVFRQLKVSKSA